MTFVQVDEHKHILEKFAREHVTIHMVTKTWQKLRLLDGLLQLSPFTTIVFCFG